jgi:hypothetical protein
MTAAAMGLATGAEDRPGNILMKPLQMIERRTR